MHAVEVIRIGQARYDASRAELRDASGMRLPVRPQTIRVLEILLAQAPRVVGRDTLRSEVWPDVVVTDDSLVQCISEIRRAIGDSRHEIVRTVARRGYLLELSASADAGAAQPPAVAEASASPPTPAQVAPVQAGAAPRRWRPRGSAAGIAGAALLASALIVAVIAARREADTPLPALSVKFPSRPALAVLAFRADPSDPGSAPLGASMAEELIGDMARDVDLPVVRRDPASRSMRSACRRWKSRRS